MNRLPTALSSRKIFERCHWKLIPHGGACCGCLVSVDLGDGYSNFVCKECGETVCKVRTDEADQILVRRLMDDGTCRATCPYCRTPNTFIGLTEIMALTCRKCGKGVAVKRELH